MSGVRFRDDSLLPEVSDVLGEIFAMWFRQAQVGPDGNFVVIRSGGSGRRLRLKPTQFYTTLRAGQMDIIPKPA